MTMETDKVKELTVSVSSEKKTSMETYQMNE